MNALGFVRSWLEDMRKVSGVDGADALMMREIEAKLAIMAGERLPEPGFHPGDPARVGDDIIGRVERLEYRRGCVEPFYEVSWWCNGSRHFEWLIEADLGPVDG